MCSLEPACTYWPGSAPEDEGESIEDGAGLDREGVVALGFLKSPDAMLPLETLGAVAGLDGEVGTEPFSCERLQFEQKNSKSRRFYREL